MLARMVHAAWSAARRDGDCMAAPMHRGARHQGRGIRRATSEGEEPGARHQPARLHGLGMRAWGAPMRACLKSNQMHGGAPLYGGRSLAGMEEDCWRGRLLAGYEEHSSGTARRMAARRMAAAAAAASTIRKQAHGYNLSGGMLCCHYLGGIGWILGAQCLVRVLCVRARGGLPSPLPGSQPVSVRCRARAPAQV